MDNKEKMMEMLKKIDFSQFTPEPVFSEEYYELFKQNNLSPEEIEVLENAELKTRIIELLPDDEKGQERLAMALQAISKESSKENAVNFITIAQKEPEILAQLMALTEVFKTAEERFEEGQTKTSDVENIEE